jgi:hypothetical protein
MKHRRLGVPPRSDFIWRDSDEVWLGGRQGERRDVTVEGPTQYRIGFLQFAEDAPKRESFEHWRAFRERQR